MGKLIVLLCFALLAMTVVMAIIPPGKPGHPCTSNSDCCCGFVCNPWAQRCTGGPGGLGPGGPVGLSGARGAQ